MNIGPYRYTGTDPAGHIRDSYGFDGELARLFAGNTGAVVHKWHHYIPLYDRYFAPWRGTPLRFLEIGASAGGSLQLWRRYFGSEATIYGIDADRRCAAFDGQAGTVRIGSQDDPAFLCGVIAEMGGVDVVLDDGSHQMAHIRTTLATLFPRLSMPGLYVIEDLHTAYVAEYGGGLDAPGNLFADVRAMIDDMHHWYHDGGLRHPASAGALSGLHVHDSMLVLEKSEPRRPQHSRVGTQELPPKQD